MLPVSRDDAAAYFYYAIEAVSKFGDEGLQRWEAVIAIANRCADGGHTSPEMAYRFIQCGELVGENVREKYFDRDGMVRVASRLSPASAFAALSRWRDREVGRLEGQLPALAQVVVNSKYIPSSVGWSLSAFFEGDGLEDFTALCIENESSTVNRQYILDMAIRYLRLNEASEKSWQKLRQIAKQYSIESSELDDILTFYAENPKKENEESTQPTSHSSSRDESESIDWEKFSMI